LWPTERHCKNLGPCHHLLLSRTRPAGWWTASVASVQAAACASDVSAGFVGGAVESCSCKDGCFGPARAVAACRSRIMTSVRKSYRARVFLCLRCLALFYPVWLALQKLRSAEARWCPVLRHLLACKLVWDVQCTQTKPKQLNLLDCQTRARQGRDLHLRYPST